MKYSTTADYFYVFLGILGSTVTGFAWPALTILFGYVVDVFVEFEIAHDNATNHHLPTEEIVSSFMLDIYKLCGLMLLVMVAFISGNYTNIHCFQMFALRQMNEIKKRYFLSILKQEVAWYDRQSSGEFASRISRYTICLNVSLAVIVGVSIAVTLRNLNQASTKI